MYEKIGEKIKGLAIATFIVEVIASVIIGIVFLADGEWMGILILFCGPIVAWVSSWFLYGFGEIIDKLCDIEQNPRGGQSKTKSIDKEAADKSNREAEIKAKRKAEEKIKQEVPETAKRMTLEEWIANIEYVDITCPNCHEKLSFEKGISEAKCPFCNYELRID